MGARLIARKTKTKTGKLIKKRRGTGPAAQIPSCALHSCHQTRCETCKWQKNRCPIGDHKRTVVFPLHLVERDLARQASSYWNWQMHRQRSPIVKPLWKRSVWVLVSWPSRVALACCRPKPADRPGEFDARSLRSGGQSYPCSLGVILVCPR